MKKKEPVKFTLNNREQKKFGKIVLLIKEALSEEYQGGLHIVIGDGNMEDGNIEWCLEHAEHLTASGKIIGEALLKMSDPERSRVICAADTLYFEEKAKKEKWGKK